VVSAAVAPSTNENGNGCPAASSPSTTAATARKLSKTAMTTGVIPTRLK